MGSSEMNINKFGAWLKEYNPKTALIITTIMVFSSIIVEVFFKDYVSESIRISFNVTALALFIAILFRLLVGLLNQEKKKD